MKLPETDQEVYELLTDEEKEVFTAATAPMFRKFAIAKALLKAVAASPTFMPKDLFNQIEFFVSVDQPINLNKIIPVEFRTIHNLSEENYYFKVYRVAPINNAGYLHRHAQAPTIESLYQLYGEGIYNIIAINRTSNKITARTQIGVNQ